MPAGLESARRHAVHMVLSDWLSLPVTCAVDPTTNEFHVDDGAGRELVVADVFFARAARDWLGPATVPRMPSAVVDSNSLPGSALTAHPDLPVLFGDGAVWSPTTNGARLGLDVFGGAFFLTAGYEAATTSVRDRHGRFPLGESILHRAGLLHRPVANEYAEVLRAALELVWPGLPRPSRSFRVFSTHDVDSPFALFYCALPEVPRAAASAIRSTGSARAGTTVISAWRRVRREGVRADPANTFDAIMDADEAAGALSAFYFIPDPDPLWRTRRSIYRLGDTEITSLIQRIIERGHEVGLHASYGAHENQQRLSGEKRLLEATVSALAPGTRVRGGRHHFLRWDARTSPRDWEAAGLDYDSTMTFAEEPGFRAGSCLSFAMFDLERQESLQVRERPLILMEASLTGPRYMGLAADSEEAQARVARLKAACRHFGGEFVVLWHNDVLADAAQWGLYGDAIGS